MTLLVNPVVRNQRLRQVPGAETRSRRDDARTGGAASELPGEQSHEQWQHLERERRSQRAHAPAHGFRVGARPIGYAGEVQRELILRTPDGRLGKVRATCPRRLDHQAVRSPHPIASPRHALTALSISDQPLRSDDHPRSLRDLQGEVPILRALGVAVTERHIVSAHFLENLTPVQRHAGVAGVIHLHQRVGSPALRCAMRGDESSSTPCVVDRHPPAVDQPGAVASFEHSPDLSLDLGRIP